MSEMEHAPPRNENAPAKAERNMHGAVCRHCGQADRAERMVLLDHRYVCHRCLEKGRR